MAKKPPFMAGYKTYDVSQGHGSPSEWKEAFNVRMDLDEAVAVLSGDDPWVLLGLGMSVTPPTLKKAYLRMAKKWHPDCNKGNETEAEAMFKKIQAAYVKLGGK